MTRVIRSSFLIGFFVICCVMGSVQAQEMFASPLIGQEAPNSVLKKVKGGSGSFQEAMNGKKAVMIFWATWCPHCREQLKAINEKKAELEQKDIVVILVNIGENKSQIEKFLKDKGYDFDVFMDIDSSAAEMYQVLGIPTIVLIGSNGRIRDVQYQFPSEYADILK